MYVFKGIEVFTTANGDFQSFQVYTILWIWQNHDSM